MRWDVWNYQYFVWILLKAALTQQSVFKFVKDKSNWGIFCFVLFCYVADDDADKITCWSCLYNNNDWWHLLVFNYIDNELLLLYSFFFCSELWAADTSWQHNNNQPNRQDKCSQIMFLQSTDMVQLNIFTCCNFLFLCTELSISCCANAVRWTWCDMYCRNVDVVCMACTYVNTSVVSDCRLGWVNVIARG